MLRYAITRGDWGGGDTFRARLPGPAERLQELAGRVQVLAAAGVDAVLIREKHLPAGELAQLARALVQAAHGSATRVLVAGRADVACCVRAQGVHLASGPGELTPGQVRQVHPGAWVTMSCHTLAEVDRARLLGADAILFAPVFAKVVAGAQVVQGVGVASLGRAVERAGPVPVLALGGITGQNSAACLAQGAAGIAAIRLFGL